jgi:hypothetical protein
MVTEKEGIARETSPVALCSAEQFKFFSRTSKNAAQLPLVTVDSTGLRFATLQNKLNVFTLK